MAGAKEIDEFFHNSVEPWAGSMAGAKGASGHRDEFFEHHAVVVIGAGWAGLSVGYKLREAGIGHVILERARVCETWRTQRWDSGEGVPGELRP